MQETERKPKNLGHQSNPEKRVPWGAARRGRAVVIGHWPWLCIGEGLRAGNMGERRGEED